MTAVENKPARHTRRTRELVVQLNTRVSLESRDLIDEIASREGLSIRSVVEQAIEAQWGHLRTNSDD
ncbi:hypothetical protein [Subtercola boreus]|nr:hypothetical protein [Subtercola boreus]TQL46850.1 hypothetical protein FB464_3844 [Subtercola boreus]